MLCDALRAYCSVPDVLGSEKPVEMGEAEAAGSAWAPEMAGSASNGRSRRRVEAVCGSGLGGLDHGTTMVSPGTSETPCMSPFLTARV